MSHFPGLAGFAAGRPAPPTWEREQLDRAETDREARVALAEARDAADRLAAAQAASRGHILCCHCGAEVEFAAERCPWSECERDPRPPAGGIEEPPFARLHDLSVEAIRDSWDRASADDCDDCSGEAA